METKKVVALVSSYNNARFLPTALDSIRTQTYKNIEVIVVDDCSTDESWSILQEYEKNDARFCVNQNDANKGISAVRNKLFSLVPNDASYIAILDSDDVMVRERIEKQVAYLEKHEEVSVVGSSVSYIDESGCHIRDRSYQGMWCGKDSRVLFNPIVANGASMFRKGVFEEVGPYDEALLGAEDYDFWLRLLLQGKCIANIHEPLLEYRLHKGQGTMMHNKNHKHGFRGRWKFLWSGFFSIRGLIVTLVTGFLALLPRPMRNTVRVMAIKLSSY